jgi:porin
MANILIGFNSEKAGLWKGGQLFINAANTHGGHPSGKLIGDFQVASNIEAGNHTYLQELWFKQAFGPVELTAGLQDLNVEFANTENGSLYLNSSFGIITTISCNVPAPVFPLTSLGFSLKWQISEKVIWLAAIYDGSPTDFEDNPYNVRWELNSDGGSLAISEMQYSTTLNDYPGIYKLGLYTHHHSERLLEGSAEPETDFKTNYGLYAIADQTVWQASSGNQRLGMFIQLGLSPARFNQNYFYTGLGLNYSGLLNKQGDDVIGLALAHVGLQEDAHNETTMELTYRVPLTPNIFIQPDFQYIINPAGTGERLDNCFAATFQFGLNF